MELYMLKQRPLASDATFLKQQWANMYRRRFPRVLSPARRVPAHMRVWAYFHAAAVRSTIG